METNYKGHQHGPVPLDPPDSALRAAEARDYRKVLRDSGIRLVSARRRRR